jgi:hypothetical protein
LGTRDRNQVRSSARPTCLSGRGVPNGWQSEEAAWAVGFVPCALSTGCAEHAAANANGMASGSMWARDQRAGERSGLSRWSDWTTMRLGMTQADGYARARDGSRRRELVVVAALARRGWQDARMCRGVERQRAPAARRGGARRWPRRGMHAGASGDRCTACCQAPRQRRGRQDGLRAGAQARRWAALQQAMGRGMAAVEKWR